MALGHKIAAARWKGVLIYLPKIPHANYQYQDKKKQKITRCYHHSKPEIRSLFVTFSLHQIAVLRSPCSYSGFFFFFFVCKEVLEFILRTSTHCHQLFSFSVHTYSHTNARSLTHWQRNLACTPFPSWIFEWGLILNIEMSWKCIEGKHQHTRGIQVLKVPLQYSLCCLSMVTGGVLGLGRKVC